MTDDRNIATELLVIAARGVSKSMSDALRPHGLAPAQFGILDLLDREGTLYPSTIARTLGIETSTTATTLKRTEAHGFITREPDPADARGVVVKMTPKGQAVLPSARESVRHVEVRTLKELNDDDQRTLKALLGQIIMNMK